MTGTAVGAGQDSYGKTYSLILRTTDGGQSWTNQPAGLGSAAPGYTLYGVSFVNAMTGTAVGWGYNDVLGQDMAAIMRTTDGGETWTQKVFSSRQLVGVHFTDALTGTVVGGRGDAIGSLSVVMRTTDAGANWTTYERRSAWGGLSAVSFADPQTGVAVGNSVLRTSDGGASWAQWGQDAELRDVTLVDPDNGWAVGDFGTTVRTTDGGAHWSVHPTGVGGSLRAVSFVDHARGIAAGEGGAIVTTEDGGLTWQVRSGGTSANLTGAYCGEGGLGIVAGDGGMLLRTTDGGATWVRMTSVDAGINFTCVRFVGTATGFALGTKDQNGFWCIVLRTTDAGLTWTEVARLPDIWDPRFGLADGSVGILTGSSGELFRTSDGGVSWTRQDGFTNGQLTGASFAGSNVGVVGGAQYFGCGSHCGYSLCVIYRTTDGGLTWTNSLNTERDGGINAVALADAHIGIAVGSRGLILRTTTGGSTWVNQEPPFAGGVPSETKLQQNYPNPFNPQTKIRFSIMSTQHTTLTVYDILGRRVAVLVDEKKAPGRYEVAFDGARLASGMYIYRLTAGPYVETRKMLLLK
jgi:photosystem II stability/assembly factor-like uncharacterized protein